MVQKMLMTANEDGNLSWISATFKSLAEYSERFLSNIHWIPDLFIFMYITYQKLNTVSPLSGPIVIFTVANMFLHAFWRQRSWSQSGPSMTMSFSKIFTVYATDPNFSLVMAGGSNGGRGTRLSYHSDHDLFHPVYLGLGNSFYVKRQSNKFYF